MDDPIAAHDIDTAPQDRDRASAIVRGLLRHFTDLGISSLAEMTLANGRRADLVGIDTAGRVTIVEVKSCRADFLTDEKWRDYLGFCDCFFFGVDKDFPRDILPTEVGLIIADKYGAKILSERPHAALSPARRKAITLRFARLAADRLSRSLLTPDIPDAR